MSAAHVDSRFGHPSPLSRRYFCKVHVVRGSHTTRRLHRSKSAYRRLHESYCMHVLPRCVLASRDVVRAIADVPGEQNVRALYSSQGIGRPSASVAPNRARPASFRCGSFCVHQTLIDVSKTKNRWDKYGENLTDDDDDDDDVMR